MAQISEIELQRYNKLTLVKICLEINENFIEKIIMRWSKIQLINCIMYFEKLSIEQKKTKKKREKIESNIDSVNDSVNDSSDSDDVNFDEPYDLDWFNDI